MVPGDRTWRGGGVLLPCTACRTAAPAGYATACRVARGGASLALVVLTVAARTGD